MSSYSVRCPQDEGSVHIRPGPIVSGRRWEGEGREGSWNTASRTSLSLSLSFCVFLSLYLLLSLSVSRTVPPPDFWAPENLTSPQGKLGCVSVFVLSHESALLVFRASPEMRTIVGPWAHQHPADAKALKSGCRPASEVGYVSYHAASRSCMCVWCAYTW